MLETADIYTGTFIEVNSTNESCERPEIEILQYSWDDDDSDNAVTFQVPPKDRTNEGKRTKHSSPYVIASLLPSSKTKTWRIKSTTVRKVFKPMSTQSRNRRKSIPDQKKALRKLSPSTFMPIPPSSTADTLLISNVKP